MKFYSRIPLRIGVDDPVDDYETAVDRIADLEARIAATNAARERAEQERDAALSAGGDPGAEIVHRAKVFAAENGLPLGEALRRVMRHPANAHLLQSYNQQASCRRYVAVPALERFPDPSASIAARARELVELGVCGNLSEACKTVVRQNPELGEAYNNWCSVR